MPSTSTKLAADASARDASTSTASEPRGLVRFVIQRVEAVCMIGDGPGHMEARRFKVGTDLLLETRLDDDEKAKPERDYVFCPQRDADGKPTGIPLNTWRNCRAYSACTVVDADAGDRVEVRCGKDTVSIEIFEGRTIVRGSFGTRQLAPYPLHIALPKRETRAAAVDC